MSEMNIEPVLILAICSCCLALVALAAFFVLCRRVEARKPVRIRVPVAPLRSFVLPDTDFQLPARAGFGTRYSNRGPPVPAPLRPADANPDRRST